MLEDTNAGPWAGRRRSCKLEGLGQKTRGRRRWVVERTFAWLSFNRRRNRDYEFLPETTGTLIYVAMIRLMVRRLAS